MSRLTNEQIKARYYMYEEAIEHLDKCVHDNSEELEQSQIVQEQIRVLQTRFYNKYAGIINTHDQ